MGLRKGQTNSGSFKKGYINIHKGERINIFKCPNCHKEVKTSDNRRKYCSHKCHLRYEYITGKRKVNPNFHGKKGTYHGNKTSFVKKDTRITKENNYNWRGGISPLYLKIRKSKEWKIWRNKVFERDNFTCQECHKKELYLHPHHIIPVKDCIATNRLDLIFDINNGKTLCRDCHYEFHYENYKKGD